MKKHLPLHQVAHHSLLFHFLIFSLVCFSPARAAPASQGVDPVAQCAEGWRLYESDDYAGALPLLEAGYLNREQGAFIDPEDLGECAMALGIVYEDFGQPENALEVEAFALEIFEKNNLPRGIATTLGEMGRAFSDMAQYDKALGHYQRSIDAWEQLGDQQYKGRVMQAMSEVYRKQGQYARALDLLQQALAIAQATGDRAAEATTLGDIGRIYNEQGQPREALEYLEQALTIEEELDRTAGRGIVLGNIGGAYETLKDDAEALRFYQQALTIFQALRDPQQEAILLSNIGGIYQSRGQYAEALRYYQQALSIQRSIPDPAGEATTLNNIGGVYHLQAKYEEALDYYRQALRIVQVIDFREGEARTLNNIGMLQQARGSLPEAVEALEQAIQILEILRLTTVDDIARASYIEQYANLYAVALVLHYQLEQYDQAFLISERARARAFLDSLSTGQVKFGNEQDAALYVREQEAYAALSIAQDALSVAKSKNPPDEELVKQLEAEVIRAEQEHQNTLDSIRVQSEHLRQLTLGRTSVLGVTQTQTLLGEDTTLLSFWIIEDSVVVFILTEKTFDKTFILIDPADLTAKIEAIRSFDSTAESFPESAVDLYQTLIDPLKPYLNSSHLIIVPHGQLHYLPFAALTDGKRYLMDDYVITYLPSASTLPFIQKNAHETGGQSLILGNPDTGDYDPSRAYFQRDQLGPLPFAEHEASEIAKGLGVTPYVQEEATETLVKQQAPETQILHLAAHGIFNPASPLDSLIALASDGENDGWLTVGEVYGLDLNTASLVVLSACDTQMGQLTAGDEFVGLTRALFFAGAPTVIASLWSVDDAATSLLMEQFYKYLREGKGKGEALRQAQADIREQYPNPYYWAAFVLNGDIGSVIIETGAETPSPALTPVTQTAPSPAPRRLPNCGNGLLLLLFAVGVVRLSRMHRSS